jgi:2-polyprenyl-3-methyl-5-hydroxy-6-metoxy-1,4-benzoquinol methylase
MLAQRSLEKEILDGGPENYTQTEYQECMKKLFLVNQLFGFFSATKRLLKKYSSSSSLLDVGCGSGLFLINLKKYFPKMNMTGIDISADAIQLSKSEQAKQANQTIHFQLREEKNLRFNDQSFDIVLATLVCHHLQDDELVIFLQEAIQLANKAVILNDLHRHPIAHALYKMTSPILFRNKLITHDGLISIRRGFTLAELKKLLQKAAITNYKITWGFPFRWQIVIQK